jgi:low affinity Fe/Cu permease
MMHIDITKRLRRIFMLAHSPISFVVMLIMLFLFIVFIAQRVLFALAAYHDAQAQGNPNSLLWGLAVGLFGLIPGIIYLCVRGTGSRMARCVNCGYQHDVTDFYCPKCGQKNTDQMQANPYGPLLAARAKKELYAGLAVIAAGLLMVIFVWTLCLIEFS